MVDAVALVPTEGVSLADIDAVLIGTLGATRTDGGRIARVYYDTFDGRLHRSGLVAEHELLDGRRWLRVRRLGETTTLVQAAVDTVEGPVATLADRRLRQLLEGPAAGRALLAVVATEGELARYAVTDELDKTVVRVSVVTGYAVAPPANPTVPSAPPAADRHVLDPIITVSPVRGHDAAYHRALVTVTTRLGERLAADPLRRAAGAAGITLGIDPSDRRVELVADAPASASLERLLRRFADVLEANTAGVIGRIDDEFLHEFRVTLRSARAVVQAADGILAEAARAELATGLRALMRLSSTPRDLDVLAAAWADDEDLAPWLVALDDERTAAHAALAEALEGPPLADLLASLRAPVPTEGRPTDGKPTDGKPTDGPALDTATWAANVVPDALRRLHRQARRARRVDPHGEDHAALHATRKAAKRLRYLLDAFDPLDPEQRLRSLRRSLRHLQQDLGALQDTVVAIDTIERLARSAVPDASPAALLRLGQRSEQLRRSGQAAAESFADSYRPLAKRRAEHAERARRLGAPPLTGSAS